jgi:hypothetical protein
LARRSLGEGRQRRDRLLLEMETFRRSSAFALAMARQVDRRYNYHDEKYQSMD